MINSRLRDCRVYFAIATVGILGTVVFAIARSILSNFSYYELSCSKGNDLYRRKFSNRALVDAASRQQQLRGWHCSIAKRSTFLIP
ncbi:hypothetical protein [Oscillatoria sp. FACHB-1406]|uniref:hypothetical protein n=1 Tax=Oscillatoria sp. FACHB-1406 TaxID=2692846 RepID=UPI001686710B|nr:hypothetical protein [Oscillatoria sp. FACHB-1406]MBD2580241.1 hypothetical protein [Oscillatoria sp. FACHB-1406]